MKIEEGKFYRSRDGRKVGPISYHDGTAYDTDERIWSAVVSGSDRLYRATTGRHLFGNEELDIVSEWLESPVRTVTRREIVDGTYGIASISTYDETRCRIGLEKNILTAEDFRELAHLANQLAEALEENK